MEQFKGKIYRKILVGATEIDTGKELVYDFDDLKEEEYIDAVIASASVPVIFPFTVF